LKPADLTLLIVDDDADLVEIMCRTFQEMGFNILTASSGTAALGVLKENQVDVVLSDIQMPNGDGIELLAEIMTNHHEPPVFIFITGHPEISRQDLLAKGATAVFPKPFELEAVYQAIIKTMGAT